MANYLWASKKERREDPSRVGLIQLAYPMLLESILRTTVSLVDVAFLSRVSDSAVSAVSVANQYIIICQILSSAVATGTLVCINQALGMKNYRKVNSLASIAVAANLALGLLFGVIFLCCSPLVLSIMKLDAEALAAAGLYLRLCGGMMFFQCVEIVLSSLCRSLGRTKAPLLINLLANLVNVAGNYVAIFHPEALGVSQIAGVALASVLSRAVALAMAFIIAYRAHVRLSPRYLWPLPVKDFQLALSIGIPGGVSNLAYSLSQLVTTSIISLLGTSVVATKVYVTNIVHYIALLGMAFSGASSLMVGYRIGAGKYDEANAIRSLVTKVAVCSNAFFSLVVICFRVQLIAWFTDNPAVVAIAANVLLIDFVVEIGRALNNSLSGALQAAGDVRYQLIVNQASGWLVSVAGSYLFGILIGWGLYGVWLSFALDEMTRGLLLLRRWRSQKWIAIAEKKRRIIAS